MTKDEVQHSRWTFCEAVKIQWEIRTLNKSDANWIQELKPKEK